MSDTKRVIELVKQKRKEVMEGVAKRMPEPLSLVKMNDQEHADFMELRFQEEEARLLEEQGIPGGSGDFRMLLMSEPEGVKELRRYYRTRGLDTNLLTEQVKELP